MAARVRWGVLSTAKIAVEKVIPAMQRGEFSTIGAIASRDGDKAREWAGKLGIPKAYGSYDELLADPEIDAIYNPLPNHMHLEWSVRAAEKEKHVLCEKPVGLNAGEARELMRARDRAGVKIGEAFMARTHPQWLRARDLIREGRIGELRAMSCIFSFFNRDPGNIRNSLATGGGSVMDIGCYPITLSRMMFAEEPKRVMALVERDPEMKIDRLTSAMLDYPGGQCVFTCSMQVIPYQRVHLVGTRGRIEIEIPFNAANDRPMRLFIDNHGSLFGDGIRTEEIPTCDQYAVQGDLFSRAILSQGDVPVPLEEAVRNMAVIDAVYRSGQTGNWETPEI